MIVDFSVLNKSVGRLPEALKHNVGCPQEFVMRRYERRDVKMGSPFSCSPESHFPRSSV